MNCQLKGKESKQSQKVKKLRQFRARPRKDKKFTNDGK